jgi:hypothetical protein
MNDEAGNVMRALVSKGLEIRRANPLPEAPVYQLQPKGKPEQFITRGTFSECADRAIRYPSPAETDAAFDRARRSR